MSKTNIKSGHLKLDVHKLGIISIALETIREITENLSPVRRQVIVDRIQQILNILDRGKIRLEKERRKEPRICTQCGKDMELCYCQKGGA